MFSITDLKKLLDELREEAEALEGAAEAAGIAPLMFAQTVVVVEKARAAIQRRRTALVSAGASAKAEAKRSKAG
jgi:hypothetical protein